MNLNSGWGQSVAASFPLRTNGKVFLVGDSDVVDIDRMKELFGVDPDGELRYLSDIDSAVSACTADRGDIILVAPGHSEDVTAASGINLDVSGIRIIGLGEGENRPTVRFTTAATADIEVAADDIRIEGIRFVAAFADLQTMFEVGAAKNFTLVNCEALEEETDENFVNVVRTGTTDNAADGLTIRGCTIIGADSANDEAVLLQGDVDRFVFENNYVSLAVANGEAVIGQATGKDMTNVSIKHNDVYRLNTSGDIFIDNDTTANSGIVAFNLIGHADTAGEVLIDADGVRLFENRGTATDTASGYVLPAIDS